MKRKLLFILLVCSFLAAHADTELEKLKIQLNQQQQIIQKLKQKIDVIEERQKESSESNFQKPAVTSPFNQPQVNPNISVIMDTSYVSRDIPDSIYDKCVIPDFAVKGHGEEDINKNRGYNLNYGEMTIYSPIDPKYDLYAHFHLAEHEFAIEELYFNTRDLPYSLNLKVGKFKSSIGRINKKHRHAWAFADQPLVFNAFFGADNLGGKGAELTWLLPTNSYWLLGIGSFNGESEKSFGNDGFDLTVKGNPVSIRDTKVPDVTTLFLKTSKDFGNLTLLGGLSYITGKARLNYLEDDKYAISGTSKIYGADLTAKYLIDSYKYLEWQTEYLYRKINGIYYVPDTSATVLDGSALSLRKYQDGYYSQLVWKLDKDYSVGIRYDKLGRKNENYIAGIDKAANAGLSRYSAMIQWKNTEFSSIRLQLNKNMDRFLNNIRKDNNEIILQFTMAIGAHGAHSF